MTFYDNNNPETFNGAPKLEIAAHRFNVVRGGVINLLKVVGVEQAPNAGNVTQNYGVTGDVMLKPASANIPKNIILETKQEAEQPDALAGFRESVAKAHDQGDDQTALRHEKDAEAAIISLAKRREDSGETYAQEVA